MLFKHGREFLKDEHRPDMPVLATTLEITNKFKMEYRKTQDKKTQHNFFVVDLSDGMYST